MKKPSKGFLRSAGLAFVLAVAAAMPGKAIAQDYPNQDIRLICAFPAGNGADVLVFAEKLRPIVNRTVRTGAIM